MMDDEKRNPRTGAEQEDNEEKSETPRQPVSRYKKLTGALDGVLSDAEMWDSIEKDGTPQPSYDGTNPIPHLPEEYQPVPRPALNESEPSDQAIPRQESEQALPSKRSRPKPRFPHPTDPIASQQTPDDYFANQERVDPIDDILASPLLRQKADNTPVTRITPPPDQLKPVSIDENGMPIPETRGVHPHPDLDVTMPAGTISHDTPVSSAMPDDTLPAIPKPTPVVISRPTSVPGPYAQARARVVPPPAVEHQTQPAPASHKPQASKSSQPQQAKPSQKAIGKPAKKAKTRGKPSFESLLRNAFLGAMALLVLLLLGLGVGAILYSSTVRPAFAGITSVEDLQARSLQFETTRIRDRDGNILYQINDPNGGLRDAVPLEEMSPWVIVSTVSTEDRDFFINPGFSIYGIIRAAVQNLKEGEIISGASTITQQVTRTLLISEEERFEQSYIRKLKEVFLAAELGRRFSKEDILELYLNQSYYGNLAYGIEAAAQTYYQKSARDLNLAEASFLAGLLQGASFWDPVTNREGAIIRHGQVLDLMLEAGCLNVGNSYLEPPCTTSEALTTAAADIERVHSTDYHMPDLAAKYPHWVVYIQQLLEADPNIGPAIYTSGFDVYTTLDPRIQDAAQAKVAEVVDSLADRNVNNASVVAIDVDTGAILAMVGSRNFNDDSIDGQVNVAITPQQPGSSIKPFTYLTAFRRGWTPATVLWDVPIEYEIPGFGIYAPVNYDGRFYGPVAVRTAIANSYNVPAVEALDFVGVPALLKTLNDVGISSLGDETNPYGYGLSLTLGAGEVYLLEWTNAFATIANNGIYHPTYAIERIERNGQPVAGYPYVVPEGRQALDPDHAFLMADILSDGNARVPAFGSDSILTTPYEAGAKTGTTNDYRDNWTMGFTSEITVGVWVGNTDNSPMINVSGVTGAGPIWRGVMDAATQWYTPRDFARPASIFPQTICPDDGTGPIAGYCLEHVPPLTEWFSVKSPPPPADEGIYRTLRVDSFTGMIANVYCDEYVEEIAFIIPPNHSQLIRIDDAARNWLMTSSPGQFWAESRGISAEQLAASLATPPTQECTQDTPRPQLVFDNPAENSQQTGLLAILGTASAPDFSHYRIDVGVGTQPDSWETVQGRTSQAVIGGIMAQFDLATLANGPITLRLRVFDQQGHMAEETVTFYVNNPTPTSAPTSTAEPTATQTEIPTVEAATPVPTSETP